MPAPIIRSAILAAALIAALAGVASAQRPQPGSVFTIAKVPVKAEAADAVEAKQIAIVQGQKQALQLLMKRLTGFSAHNRLPQLDDAAIERMVDGMQVRSERNSGTVYLAELDFNFQQAAVKDILSRFGFAYVADRAPEISVLPVFLQDGAVVSAPGNAWSRALAKLDLTNALTPVALAAPRPDMTAEQIKSALSGGEALEQFSYQYRAQYLILAIAEMDASAASLTLRLAGRDASGFVKLERRFKVYDGYVEEAAERAAKITVNMFQSRWKLTRLASQGALEGPQNLEAVELTAEFSGLREWRVIRDRLQKTPGVQSVDVRSVNPRGASISLEYPGGAQQLARAAQRAGLAMEDGGGVWVLRAQ